MTAAYSGPADLPVLKHIGRECYSEPAAVYEQALRRGMDLVTLTDHDSIEGALAMAPLSNTFVSEEVTVILPEGRQLHVNVFDIDEARHEAIQARRRDPEALFAYLAEQRIPASVNHLFSALTGARALADLRLPLGRLPLIETLNGSMPEPHNEHARRVAAGGPECHRALAAAAVSAGLANIVLVLVKGQVRRPRPCDVARPRNPEMVRRYVPSDRYSFPSGHSLNAFAMAAVLALTFPPLAGPLLLVAANVAASRVVLGRHFLSDVLAGSALGALIGGLVFLVFLA